MLAIRKLLNKPKLTDNRPLSVFYFCDESVNHQMQELNYLMRTTPDNLDRRATLIKQLKEAQHNLMNVIFAIIQEAVPAESLSVRDFRAKYPDDVLVDQINGPLWFGAECIAAGSHILNHELESEELRPYALHLSKAICRVRLSLKDQCLTNRETYPQKLKDMLQAFDIMWTDFEFRYVSLMCTVKSEKQYYHQQDVIVLFCESTLRGLKKRYISHDMIEMMDPSIMFAIPRLAIVCGLAVYPEGPLNPSKPAKEIPSFFRGYRTLLGRIKELLAYLTEEQLCSLERSLCSSEGIGSLSSPSLLAASLLQRPLSSPAASYDTESMSTAPFSPSPSSPYSFAASSSSSPSSPLTLPSSASSSSASSPSSPYSSQPCSSPASPNLPCRHSGTVAAATSHHRSRSLGSRDLRQSTVRADQSDVHRSRLLAVNSDLTAVEGGVAEMEVDHAFPRFGPDQPVINNLPIPTTSSSSPACTQTTKSMDVDTKSRTSSALSQPSPRPSRHRGNHSHSRGPAGFVSAEDLMHRLFVAISGVADQLQTNHARDLRVILKHVFTVCQMEEEEEEGEGEEDKYEGAAEVEEDLFMTETRASFTGFSAVERFPFATSSLSTATSWVADRECVTCASCHENFNWRRRKHHCRSCGQVVCGRCSPHSLPVLHLGQTRTARVCTTCYLQQLGEVVRLSASPPPHHASPAHLVSRPAPHYPPVMRVL